MITLYDCATAPSPRRARILLAEKGLTYETVQVDLRNGEQLGDAYRQLNPQCSVPTLRTEEALLLTDIAGMQDQTDELNRQSQSGLYKKSASAKLGKMEGAKYRIEGNITSIVKTGGNLKDVYYKFSLIMTDVEGGTIEWADEKEIRKTACVLLCAPRNS